MLALSIVVLCVESATATKSLSDSLDTSFTQIDKLNKESTDPDAEPRQISENSHSTYHTAAAMHSVVVAWNSSEHSHSSWK